MPSPYRTVIESMFQITDRRGQLVDFTLTPEQAILDEGWSRRNLVTKLRQHGGISTYVLARYIAKCLVEKHRRCVLVSAEADATARLLGRARFILNHLKGGLEPELGTDNQKAIVFTRTDSSFWIGTAGSRTFGRGDTITDLHLSEAAFYAKPEDITQGLFPAAELGEITVESTGNGVGNWFHRQALRAHSGSGFKLFFFPWVGVPTCQLDFPSLEARSAFHSSLREDYEEADLLEKGITLEQLAWRRERLDIEYEGDLSKFRAEYPMTFDECFQATGYSFFRKIKYVPTSEWQRQGLNFWKLKDHPKPGSHYVIGGDVSAGVGRDASVGNVICIETLEQVGRYSSNGIDPDLFAIELAHLGTVFNKAYINVEQNTYGLTTLRRLRDGENGEPLYPRHLIHRGRTQETGSGAQEVALDGITTFGTFVSKAVKGAILGGLRACLREGLIIHDPITKGELDTFVEKDGGSLEAESGCHDDEVLSLAHAVSCIERAAAMLAQHEAPPKGEPSPFSFESIFSEQNAGNVLPFPVRYG